MDRGHIHQGKLATLEAKGKQKSYLDGSQQWGTQCRSITCGNLAKQMATKVKVNYVPPNNSTRRTDGLGPVEQLHEADGPTKSRRATLQGRRTDQVPSSNPVKRMDRLVARRMGQQSPDEQLCEVDGPTRFCRATGRGGDVKTHNGGKYICGPQFHDTPSCACQAHTCTHLARKQGGHC